MPLEGDTTLLTSKQKQTSPPKTSKQLPRLSYWARLAKWIRQHFRKRTHAWWTWEISAATVSSMSLVLLISVLVQADKKLQQSWAVAGTQLTLNTIVAAIGTVMRTSLYVVVAGGLNQSAWNWFVATDENLTQTNSYGRPLKDLEVVGEAAANSWSCMKLLWRTRCRYLMSVGALVMILTIGFDTFLQQVLSTEQQVFWAQQDSRNFSADNTISHVQTLNFSDPWDLGATTALDMQTLQNNWLLHGSSSFAPPTCPSDSCNWPVTPTLGLCTECKTAVPVIHQTFNDSCANITTYSLDRAVNITILDCGASGHFNKQVSWRLTTRGDPDYPPSSSSRAAILAVYLLGTDIDDPQLKYDAMTIQPLLAYKCPLFFCVQGYQAHTIAGRTTQAFTGTKSLDFRQDSMGHPPVGQFINIPPELNVKAESQFKVDNEASAHIMDAMYMFFEAQIIYSFSDKGFAETGFGANGNNILGEVLWENRPSLENVSQLLENYVSGFTSYLSGTNDLPADPYYAPDVASQLPVVIVRWPWLSYPVFLQISGLIFLFLTMRQTRRRRIRAWKGHRVALLLANLDESLRDRARGGLASRTGLDDRVGEALVHLDFDGEDGLVFRRVDPSNKETGGNVHSCALSQASGD